MFIESPEDALRSFGGELGRHLALGYESGAILFGMRIPDVPSNSLHFVLEEAYQAILGHAFDWVVPLVIDDGSIIGYSDRGDPESFAGQLARFCMANLSMMAPSIGLIQVASEDTEPAYARQRQEGITPYQSLVAAVPAQSSDDDGNPINVAAIAACYLAALPRNRGVAGCQITSIKTITPEYLSDTDIKRLTRRGMLAIDYSPRKGVTLQNAVTQNPNGPSLSSLRAVFNCLHRVRYSLRPMIGEPQTSASIAAERQIIESIFDEHPWIVEYNFTLERSGLHGRVIRTSVLTHNEVTRADVLARVSG